MFTQIQVENRSTIYTVPTELRPDWTPGLHVIDHSSRFRMAAPEAILATASKHGLYPKGPLSVSRMGSMIAQGFALPCAVPRVGYVPHVLMVDSIRGRAATRLCPGTLRLICSNGAVVFERDQDGKRRVPHRGDYLSNLDRAFEATVGAAARRFERDVELIEASRAVFVNPEPTDALEHALGVRATAAALLMADRYTLEGGYTAWSIFQGATESAQELAPMARLRVSAGALEWLREVVGK